MRDPELEAMKDVSVKIRTLNLKNKLDLRVSFSPQVAELVLTESKSKDELIRLSGGTTIQLFNRLLEELPILITRYGWEE